MPFTFFEFFAGGGMARAGLGPAWVCKFANDYDFKKCAVYAQNWGDREIVREDVSKLSSDRVPEKANLIWASFPCQDLSLAGMGSGLRGNRSGTFWPFWDLVKQLQSESREPDILLLENVCGTLTSHNGKDFEAIADALTATNYRFGALVMDAVDFLPQSRPRLFIIGVSAKQNIPSELISELPLKYWHTRTICKAHERLKDKTRGQWVWWNLPEPTEKRVPLEKLIEENPTSVLWHSREETTKLLSMMSNVHLEKVEAAKHAKHPPIIGTIYKRTRMTGKGVKVQRAEVRFDGIAGCLRTPAGGSSRQVILIVNEREIRSRLISARETARLMGLPDSYKLPEKYNEAYHLTGDGVVVPVVRYLAENLLEPLLVSRFTNQ